MANILQCRFCNTMVACITTVAFTTATLTPPPLMAEGVNLDFNAINFGIKIERIYEKLRNASTKERLTRSLVTCSISKQK